MIKLPFISIQLKNKLKGNVILIPLLEGGQINVGDNVLLGNG